MCYAMGRNVFQTIGYSVYQPTGIIPLIVIIHFIIGCYSSSNLQVGRDGSGDVGRNNNSKRTAERDRLRVSSLYCVLFSFFF